MSSAQNPIRTPNDEARKQARMLLTQATYCALAVLDPETGAPHVTRIAIGTTPMGDPVTLISDLSTHTKALKSDPRCSILLGEPKAKGDPLTHPRISLDVTAQFITRNDTSYAKLRDHYLSTHPKSKLYIDFADFNFVIFEINSAALNAGFGKAYQMKKGDII